MSLEIYNKISSYVGPKVALVVTGGGLGIVDLLKTIGASKVIHSIEIPYSETATQSLLKQNLPNLLPGSSLQSVSEEMAIALYRAMKNKLLKEEKEDIKIIVVTAALSSSRWRRGDNHAWVAKGSSINGAYLPQTFHLELDKLSEEEYKKMFPGYVDWKRHDEDRRITDFLMKLIFEE